MNCELLPILYRMKFSFKLTKFEVRQKKPILHCYTNFFHFKLSFGTQNKYSLLLPQNNKVYNILTAVFLCNGLFICKLGTHLLLVF